MAHVAFGRRGSLGVGRGGAGWGGVGRGGAGWGGGGYVDYRKKRGNRVEGYDSKCSQVAMSR